MKRDLMCYNANSYIKTSYRDEALAKRFPVGKAWMPRRIGREFTTLSIRPSLVGTKSTHVFR